VGSYSCPCPITKECCKRNCEHYCELVRCGVTVRLKSEEKQSLEQQKEELDKSMAFDQPRLKAASPTEGTKPAAVADYSGVDGKGYKASMDDPKKLPVWLVPGALVRAAARALAHGARKYAPNNWRRGMNYSEVLSALERHLMALKDGDHFDDDSKLHHLDHIAACTAFLAEFIERPEYARFNDLFVRKPE
jgi:hypothetical protein